MATIGFTEQRFLDEHVLSNAKVHSTVTKEENEAGWLRARKSGIGGSDIGAICGINPYTSARQIYLDKTDQMPEELATKMNERMHFGNVLEPVVASEYARRSGNLIYNIPITFSSLELPIAHANCDRFIWSETMGPGVLECKTADKYTEGHWKDGPLPLSYMYQLQWYIYVTGLQWGNLSCLVGGNTFYSYDFPRDDALIAEMVEAAKQFWFTNVQGLVEPMLSSSQFDTDLVKSKKVNDEEVTIFDSKDLDDLADEYIRVSEEFKTVKAYQELLKNRIKETMGTAAYGITALHGFKQTVCEMQRVDPAVLLEISPKLYELCLKTTSYVRLKVE